MRIYTHSNYAADVSPLTDSLPATRDECATRKRRLRVVPRIFLLLAFVTGLPFLASIAPHAQRSQDAPVRVTGVTARRTSDGKTVYTIEADRPLNRAQTWQDGAGQHIVLFKGNATLRGNLPAGVRVGRVSESLEIVLPASERQRIVVQPRSNQLEIIVSGGDGAAGEAVAASAAETGEATKRATGEASRVRRGREQTRVSMARGVARPRSNRTPAAQPPVVKAPDAALNFSPNVVRPRETGTGEVAMLSASANGAPASGAVPAPQAAVSDSTAPMVAAVSAPVAVPAATVVTTEEGSSSFYILLIGGVAACGGLAFVAVRRRREADEMKQVTEFFDGKGSGATTGKTASKEKDKKESGKTKEKDDKKSAAADANRHAPAKTETGNEALQMRDVPSMNISAAVSPAPIVMFGAYQVDQEVGKLVQGQAHRIDVLCSRALDDRRAIETSLMKALQNAESGENVRRKARQALEDYGFVARACASLLLAPAVHDRVTAARTLSSVKSPTALQFLIEALYDRETIVRAEAVGGLGELRLPAAIGALLDIARRHADISPTLLSHALTACSVESLNFSSIGDASAIAGEPGSFEGAAWTGEITRLEPVETIVALPDWLEDETLADALERLASGDVEARAAAARQLAQFPVQPAVESLAYMAAHDAETSVRAAAVTSLGALDHETVFAPILLRLVDESREVRAAAARAFSRLNFDRADAYVRVIETSDEETIREVAASLTGAGMASQAIDRLISDDRRQAYESFSLLSLLVKAGEVAPLLEAITTHRELGVRLALIRFLGLTGGAHYIDELSHIAERDDAPQEVRAAITEAASKIAQVEAY